MSQKILKILFLLVFILTPAASQARSEINGYISTRPDQGHVDSSEAGDKSVNSPNQPGSLGSAVILSNRTQPLEQIQDEPGAKTEKEIKVLGAEHIGPDTLVRDESGRVYIIKGEYKKVIWDLKELYQYAGQPIYDFPDSDLAKYPTRRFYNNALIRLSGGHKIYAVWEGHKSHIETLTELIVKYKGQPIYDITKNEFDLY